MFVANYINLPQMFSNALLSLVGLWLNT